MLKQAFDEAQPKTIRQWWYDSRNGVQWYTFWVAVLVLVLTVVLAGAEHRRRLAGVCLFQGAGQGGWGSCW